MTEGRETTHVRSTRDEDDTFLEPDDDENDGRFSRRPLRRLTSAPMVRRLSPRKLLIGLIFGIATLIVMAMLGVRLARHAIVWLHDQPQYRLPFEEIRLDPPPPAWIRSGAVGLLSEVHRRSQWKDQPDLRVLDLAPDQITDAFRRGSPWVKDASVSVPTYPNHLNVRLEYREPVAFLVVGTGKSAREIILDGEGVVLPNDDLSRLAAEPMTELRFSDLDKVVSRLIERPGLSLRLEPRSPEEPPEPFARDACQLARFLKDHRTIAGPGTDRSPLLVRYIHQNPTGLWLETVEGALVHWCKAPGDELPGEMTAEAKLETLQNWLTRNRIDAIQYPYYLVFERGQVEVRRGIDGS